MPCGHRSYSRGLLNLISGLGARCSVVFIQARFSNLSGNFTTLCTEETQIVLLTRSNIPLQDSAQSVLDKPASLCLWEITCQCVCCMPYPSNAQALKPVHSDGSIIYDWSQRTALYGALPKVPSLQDLGLLVLRVIASWHGRI
jgi:hypothetical protein